MASWAVEENLEGGIRVKSVMIIKECLGKDGEYPQ